MACSYPIALPVHLLIQPAKDEVLGSDFMSGTRGDIHILVPTSYQLSIHSDLCFRIL